MIIRIKMCSSWTVDNFTAGDSEGCVVSVCRSKSRKAVSLIKASIAICVWHSTAVFLMVMDEHPSPFTTPVLRFFSGLEWYLDFRMHDTCRNILSGFFIHLLRIQRYFLNLISTSLTKNWAGETSETVVILSSVGVHVTKRYWSGRSTSSFIPHNLVRSVVLNEGIALVSMQYYHPSALITCQST